MNLGEAIKAARLTAGMTQTELGEAIGVSGVAIMRYEKGEREPKLATLSKIAEILDINLMEFVQGEDRQVAEQFARTWAVSDDPRIIEQERTEWAKTFLKRLTPEEKAENARRYESYVVKTVGEYLSAMNEDGQTRVLNYTRDLAKIPEYQKGLKE